jgi:OPA family glycerol-3-phosphate transporter-like MFS transporter
MTTAQPSSAAPLDPRLVPWRARAFAATWLCYAGLYFCRKPFYVVKDDLAESYGWDAGFLGQLGAAYLIAYTLGQFVSGLAGTRYGARIVLLVGMGVTVASNFAFGLTDSASAFLVFMVLNGLAQSTGWGNTVGVMGNWFRKEERGRVMGLWATCFQVGGVLGSGLAALMLGIAGFKYSFFAGSVVTLAVLGFFAWAQRNRPEDVGLSLGDQGDKGALPDNSILTEGATWTQRWNSLGWDRTVIQAVLMVGCFYFFVKFIRYMLWSWVPFLLSRNFGLEGDEAGYLSTLFDLFGIAGVIACGWLSDRLAKGKRIGVSLVFLIGMAISCGLLYLSSLQVDAATGDTGAALILFAIALSLVGFFLYGPDALMTGAAAQDIGNPRGAVLAAATINGMGSIGAVTQEFWVGGLIDESGGAMGPVLILLVGASVGAFLCLGLVRILKLADV